MSLQSKGTSNTAGIENYEKKIYDQQQLIEISKALNSNLNFQSLIDSILNVSLTQGQTLHIGIFLHPDVESADFILYKNLIGFDLQTLVDYRIKHDNEIVPFLSNLKTAVTLKELKENPKTTGFETIASIFEKLGNELLLVPLASSGKLKGIICMGPKHDESEYSSAEKSFMMDLASIAAIAVENARLYELATVDMMTKLKIHHFFQTRLKECIEDAIEGNEPLSLLLTDIDHFKIFNDTYGHQLGDVVLKEVANSVIINSRSTDVPSRYGGEEFTVILPNTNLIEAQRQAERIRLAVEKQEVENYTDVGDKVLKVTVSVGVAQFDPTIDKNPKILIERVDKALYRAKHAGRNQVALSTPQDVIKPKE